MQDTREENIWVASDTALCFDRLASKYSKSACFIVRALMSIENYCIKRAISLRQSFNFDNARSRASLREFIQLLTKSHCVLEYIAYLAMKESSLFLFRSRLLLLEF